MRERELHDGRMDGLEPLLPLDPRAIESFPDLLRAMSRTAFGGRRLGEAFEVMLAMYRDPDCLKVVTLSGAMTIAKMGLTLCRMIEAGFVDAVISTGALMAHGLSEAIGLAHYKTDPEADDTALFHKGYNRVYDTLEMESNLNDVSLFVAKALDGLPEGTVLSSERLFQEMGRLLAEETTAPGVLRSAYLAGVPVYVPAFTDSEVGLDVATWAMRRRVAEGAATPDELFRVTPAFNPFLDLTSYARLCVTKPRMGIFTIGGGVPRNWAQQVAPFYDIAADRTGVELPAPRFTYGVRLCPEPVHWGGLSGCTYKEGVSWGKFVPKEEGGRYAEVLADATLVWPLLVKAVLAELGK